MPKKIDAALRERAVRLVREHRAEYHSTAKAIAAVARQEGVGAESLRRWVVQADIDAGDRDGQTSEEHNNRRLHGSLGMVSPDEFEATYYAAITREPQPA